MRGKTIVKSLAACTSALCLMASVPATATPGFVVGEVIGSVALQVAENSALAIDLALPPFHLTYDSFGLVHDDGGDTGHLFPGYETVMAMDLYAYAFSEPFTPGFKVSQTRARGWFDDGVFATITNISALTQSVEVLLATSMSEGTRRFRAARG